MQTASSNPIKAVHLLLGSSIRAAPLMRSSLRLAPQNLWLRTTGGGNGASFHHLASCRGLPPRAPSVVAPITHQHHNLSRFSWKTLQRGFVTFSEELSADEKVNKRNKWPKKPKKKGAWWEQRDQDFNKGKKVYTPDAIQIAVKDQNIKLLERCLEQNADFQQRRDNLLMVAALHRGKQLMETLLSKGEDPNYRNAIMCTPLHYCCSHDFPRGVNVLLNYNANIEVHDEMGLTPLHSASLANSVECAALLLDHGANLHSEDKDGDTPLHTASRLGSYDVGKFFIQKGAAVNCKNFKGETPLHLAAAGDEGKILGLLLENGAAVDARDGEGLTALHRAAQNSEDKHCVAKLIEHGSNVNDTLAVGISPLHFAAYSGNLDALSLLLEAGAALNEKTHEGWSPLMIAAQEGHLGCVSYLLQKGAQIDNRNDDGLAPLHLAVAGGHSPCVALLINRGADVDVKDNYRLTPLHIAAQARDDNPLIVQTLIDNAADIDSATPEDGVTPLIAAIDHENVKIAEILLEHGANPNQTSSNGSTPLHLAVEAELPELLASLVHAGADINAKDDKGKTALDLARAMPNGGQLEDILIKLGAK